jgi:hypothetical protein
VGPEGEKARERETGGERKGDREREREREMQKDTERERDGLGADGAGRGGKGDAARDTDSEREGSGDRARGKDSQGQRAEELGGDDAVEAKQKGERKRERYRTGGGMAREAWGVKTARASGEVRQGGMVDGAGAGEQEERQGERRK